MTETTHEDATVLTSNVKASQPDQEQYKCPSMSSKPRRMISFKHESPKNKNAIRDDVEMSDIEEPEEQKEEQDDFQKFLFSRRANIDWSML